MLRFCGARNDVGWITRSHVDLPLQIPGRLPEFLFQLGGVRGSGHGDVENRYMYWVQMLVISW